MGPDILVSPVTEKGRREQMVYLPEGNWKNIDTGEIFSGRQSVCCRAELDTIPVFVKADRIDIILPKEKV